MSETNLRQANAKAFVQGTVSEKDLKVVVEDNRTKIKGYVTVKTSDTNFIRFNVNVNEKTNDNKPNKTYTGIQTVMNEYKSIAEVGADTATRVRVNGDVNPFTTQNGEVVVGYKGNFFNRPKDGEDFENMAEFSVEMFISSIDPEFDNEAGETGRTIVSGWIPTYSGIEPISLIAEGEVATAVEAGFEPGQTVEFYGNIINNRIETITEIPVKIGKPRVKKTVETKNELIITGASEAYEDGITPELPYDADTINAAINERESRLAEARVKSKSGNTSSTNAKPSGAARGRSMSW